MTYQASRRELRITHVDSGNSVSISPAVASVLMDVTVAIAMQKATQWITEERANVLAQSVLESFYRNALASSKGADQ